MEGKKKRGKTLNTRTKYFLGKKVKIDIKRWKERVDNGWWVEYVKNHNTKIICPTEMPSFC